MTRNTTEQPSPQTPWPIVVFDIGMYDGEDTRYYLESGYRVIAVEANPSLVAAANEKFKEQIAAGQLTCINAAISPTGEDVELTLTGADLGSSTLFADRVENKRPIGTIKVPGITLTQLFERYGLPHFMKVDIEGADRLCVLSLTRAKRPAFISFEVGDDAEELIAHAEKVGFTRFKIVHQNSFRELDNQANFYDRVVQKLMRQLGYQEPLMVRRAGRFFVRGSSSGPLPWRTEGKWYSAKDAQERLRKAAEANTLDGWYDVHATAEESDRIAS